MMEIKLTQMAAQLNAKLRIDGHVLVLVQPVARQFAEMGFEWDLNYVTMVISHLMMDAISYVKQKEVTPVLVKSQFVLSNVVMITSLEANVKTQI